MRNLLRIIAVILMFSACQSKNRSKEIASYEYEKATVELNNMLKEKVGEWIEKNKTCYGIVVMSNTDGKIVNAKPVKAKVVFIQSDKIKMKALEEVSLAPKEGCSKMGLSKGETWWEEEGDLFLNREDAVGYIKALIAKQKVNTGSKFTIDR